MNQKIQSLIDGGFISIEDVLEYVREYNDNAPEEEKVEDPEYIIASTSYSMEETYVFEANEDGEITNFGDYGGLAKRWGCDNWQDYYAAVEVAFGKDKYKLERRIDTGRSGKFSHFLFKRI